MKLDSASVARIAAVKINAKEPDSDGSAQGLCASCDTLKAVQTIADNKQVKEPAFQVTASCADGKSINSIASCTIDA